MSQRCVLVTGGAGYIGSHTAKALQAAGFEPVVFDDLSRGHREMVRFGPLEVGSILDQSRLREVIERYDPVGVIHFAALAYVGESVLEPARYFSTNVAGSAALINELVHAKPLPLVFSSTCAVYGNPLVVPVNERAAIAPLSPYGESKAMVERMLHASHLAHALPYIALRYFNAAGADPDGELGEWHEPEPHLIPRVIAAALAHETVEIHGGDWPTLDGSCVRDYVHVSDLADAHVLALESLLAGGDSGAFNLSSGLGFSVREVIRAVEAACGHSIRVNVGERRAGDPATVVGIAERAMARFGWQARRSTLTQIIEDAWRWHSSRKRELKAR